MADMALLLLLGTLPPPGADLLTVKRAPSLTVEQMQVRPVPPPPVPPSGYPPNLWHWYEAEVRRRQLGKWLGVADG